MQILKQSAEIGSKRIGRWFKNEDDNIIDANNVGTNIYSNIWKKKFGIGPTWRKISINLESEENLK